MSFLERFIRKGVVKAEGIQVCRIIYLSKEEFRILKILRGKFLKRTGNNYKKERKERNVLEREALECPTMEDLREWIGRSTLDYELTDFMEDSRNSLFWGWRRVKEYYREISEKYFDEKNKIRIIRSIIKN